MHDEVSVLAFLLDESQLRWWIARVEIVRGAWEIFGILSALGIGGRLQADL